MHTIFIGDKPIKLTTEIKKETNFKAYLLKTVNIDEVIKILMTTDLNAVHLIHDNKEELLSYFLKLLPNVIAGGGKVINAKDETLFIYRNDKWDLPKGKAESNETIEETAIREVEEETGIQDLSIVKSLPTTYHIFKRQGEYRIKVTYWFEMTSHYEGKFKPQKKEGITKVKWLNKKDIEKALTNSYANIKLLC